MNDDQILAGLVQGAPGAADALIEKYAPPLIRYLSVHLPDRSQAEDMAQEVFIRLLGTLRRTAPATPPASAASAGREIRSLYSLLFTIARNLAIDMTRAAARRPSMVSLDAEDDAGLEDAPRGPQIVHLTDPAPDPRTVLDAQREQEKLEEALRRLRPEFREVVVLRHIEGLGAAEIAALLGIREGTVWSRLNRGLQDLRRELTQPGIPAPSNPSPQPDSPRGDSPRKGRF